MRRVAEFLTRFAVAFAAVAVVATVGFFAARSLTGASASGEVGRSRATATCDQEISGRVAAIDERWAPTGSAYAVTTVAGGPPLGLDPWPRAENLRVAVAARPGDALRELGTGPGPIWSATGALIAYEHIESALHYTVVDVASGKSQFDVRPTLRGVGWRGD